MQILSFYSHHNNSECAYQNWFVVGAPVYTLSQIPHLLSRPCLSLSLIVFLFYSVKAYNEKPPRDVPHLKFYEHQFRRRDRQRYHSNAFRHVLTVSRDSNKFAAIWCVFCFVSCVVSSSLLSSSTVRTPGAASSSTLHFCLCVLEKLIVWTSKMHLSAQG